MRSLEEKNPVDDKTGKEDPDLVGPFKHNGEHAEHLNEVKKNDLERTAEAIRTNRTAKESEKRKNDEDSLEALNGSLKTIKMTGRELGPDGLSINKEIDALKKQMQDEDDLVEKRTPQEGVISERNKTKEYLERQKYSDDDLEEKDVQQAEEDAKNKEHIRENINKLNIGVSKKLDENEAVRFESSVGDRKIISDTQEPVKTTGVEKPKGSEGSSDVKKGVDASMENSSGKKSDTEERTTEDFTLGARYVSESQRVAESKTVKIEDQYKRLNKEGEDENDAKEKISQLERERVMAAGSAEMTRAIKRQRQNIQEGGSIAKEAGIGQMTLTAAQILEIGFNAEIDSELLQSQGMAARRLAEREGSNYYSAFNKNYYKKVETAKEGEKKVPEKDKPFEHELFVRNVNVIRNAQNRGKNSDKQHALRILLRETGREDYFDEIVSGKKYEYRNRPSNGEKYFLGITWTNKDGAERTLDFETDFAAKGNKGYKPGNMFMRNFGFWKKHPVEITTKEEIKKKTSPAQQRPQGKEQVVPPVGVEAIRKKMRDNYPETFENLSLMTEDDFDTKEEFENIGKAIASLEKGEKKPARDVVSRFILKANDAKLAMETKNEDTSGMDKTIKNLSGLLLELSGTGNKSNETEGGGDENKQWEATKTRLLKAYPTLEKIAATQGDSEKAQRYNFVVNAYLESIDDKQLTDLAKQLEKGGSVFEIPFDEDRPIGDRQEVENKYIKKITEGKWDESNTKDLNDIKKLIRGTIPFRIIGSVVKDYKDKKNNDDQAQSSEGENKEQQDSDATKKDGDKTEDEGENRLEKIWEKRREGLVKKYPSLKDFVAFIDQAGRGGKYHLIQNKFLESLDDGEIDYMQTYLEERGNKLEFKRNQTCFDNVATERKYIDSITAGEWGKSEMSNSDLTDIRGLFESLLDGRDIGDYQLPSRGVDKEDEETVKNAKTTEPEGHRGWEHSIPKKNGQEDVVTESGFTNVKGDKKKVRKVSFTPNQIDPKNVKKESRGSLRNFYLEHGETRKYTVSKEVLGRLKSLATTEDSRGDEKAIRELLGAVDLKTAEDLTSIESVYGIKKEDYGKNQFRVTYKARFPKGMKEVGVFVIDFSEADFDSDKDKQVISVHRNY